MQERRNELIAEASELAGWFVDAGHRIFLVGGVVRDLELGIDRGPDTDIDLTTDARPEQTKDVLAGRVEALWTQGERFGTIGCMVGGREYEITTHRAEAYTTDSRKPVVEFSRAIDADLSRRDFTINAMAIELPAGSLIDPFGGRADLDARLLRTPLAPEVSFSDDPLRMLRAARFATTYQVAPDPGMVAAMSSMADRLEIVSRERIRDELDKMLRADDLSAGFQLLRDAGLLTQFLPEVDDTAVDRASALRTSPPGSASSRLGLLRLAALLAHKDPEGPLRRLKYSNADIADVTQLVAGARAASDAVAANDVRAPVLRRFLTTVDGEPSEAIAVAKVTTPELALDAFVAALADLAKTESFRDLTPALSGGQIMKLLELEPGPVIGEAVAALRGLRLEEGPVPVEREQDYLREWITRR